MVPEGQVTDPHKILNPMVGRSQFGYFPKAGYHFWFPFLQKWTEKLGVQILPWRESFLDLFQQKSGHKKILGQAYYSIGQDWIELDKIEEEERATFNIYYIF